MTLIAPSDRWLMVSLMRLTTSEGLLTNDLT